MSGGGLPSILFGMGKGPTIPEDIPVGNQRAKFGRVDVNGISPSDDDSASRTDEATSPGQSNAIEKILRALPELIARAQVAGSPKLVALLTAAEDAALALQADAKSAKPS